MGLFIPELLFFPFIKSPITMSTKQRITARIVYQNLEGGFWGLIDESGNQYLPVNFPEQLKHEGRTVQVVIRRMEDGVSTAMWGQPVRIVSFGTVTP